MMSLYGTIKPMKQIFCTDWVFRPQMLIGCNKRSKQMSCTLRPRFHANETEMQQNPPISQMVYHLWALWSSEPYSGGIGLIKSSVKPFLTCGSNEAPIFQSLLINGLWAPRRAHTEQHKLIGKDQWKRRWENMLHLLWIQIYCLTRSWTLKQVICRTISQTGNQLLPPLWFLKLICHQALSHRV